MERRDDIYLNDAFDSNVIQKGHRQYANPTFTKQSSTCLKFGVFLLLLIVTGLTGLAIVTLMKLFAIENNITLEKVSNETLKEYGIENPTAQQEILNQLLLPPNCMSSSFVGYQTLRSGKKVYCDGGWNVFQKRYDGSVDFQRIWSDYKNGFGNFSTEFWLGLDQLHNATVGRGCRLRVDLWSFDDDHAFAEYSDFFIASEADLYRLHIGGYSGTAGNCFTNNISTPQKHDKMQFTTMDRDNDRRPRGNCATDPDVGPSGGWWFNNCHHCKLNAKWGRSSRQFHNNFWRQWKGDSEALKASIMKFRCD